MKKKKCSKCGSSQVTENLMTGALHCALCGFVDDGCPPCYRCGSSNTRYFDVYQRCADCGFDDEPKGGLRSMLRRAGCL